MLYFLLLQQVRPTRTSNVTFPVSLFGSIWGAVLLGEPFTALMLVGMAITFFGVGLMSGL